MKQHALQWKQSPLAVWMLGLFFAAGAVVSLFAVESYPGLHTILDTALFLLSGLLALLFWGIEAQGQRSFSKSISISFGVTSVFEFIHALVSTEWTGGLAFVTQSANVWRPGTWSISAYLLPVGIAFSIMLTNRGLRTAYWFAVMLPALGAVLFVGFHRVPVHTPSGFLGITRPSLIFVPFLWLIAAVFCWLRRSQNRVLTVLAIMAATIALSSVVMLYSRSSQDVQSIEAHLGKVAGYFFALLSLMQMAAADTIELMRAEKKFRELLASAPDAMVVVDGRGIILMANAQMERLFACTRDELVGQPIEKLVPERYRSKHSGHRDSFFAVPRSRPMGMGLELFALRSDGHEFPVEISLSPLETEGKLLASAAIRDVTQRRRSEELIRVSEERRRLIVETALSAFVAMNSEGKIVDWNRQAEIVFGWKRDEVMGRLMADLIVPLQYRDQHTRGLTHFLETGEGPLLNKRVEITALHKDGHVFPVEMTIAPLRWANEYAFNAFIQDIGSRKAAEEELRRRSDELASANAGLARANEELEAFTYSVAHDLRAPVRHVLGFSKILTEDFGPSLPPAGQECVRDIVRGAEHMGHLIDDLLALARVGRKELNVQMTGLGSVVEEVCKELERDVEGRDIVWKIGELPFLECDYGLIKQVFSNLLSNAVKYSRPRKQAIIEVGLTIENGQSVIFVRDNGVGFNMKYADKLFGVFQRLHRKEDFEGTGVGLATVQRIVDKHGGRIWAHARLNEGATFYFTLTGSPREHNTSTATMEVKGG